MATLYSSAFISDHDQAWLNMFREYSLNDRQLAALAFLRNTPKGISNGEYRDINSMNKVADDKRATRELAKMVKLGILLKSGENKTRRYYLKPDIS